MAAVDEFRDRGCSLERVLGTKGLSNAEEQAHRMHSRKGDDIQRSVVSRPQSPVFLTPAAK